MVRRTSDTSNALRRTLKATTASVHLRLERGLLLSDPRLSLAEYQRVLAAYLGFYQPLETRLEPLRPADLTSERLQKHLWLTQDLKHWGLNSQALAKLPRCEALPPVRDENQAMGCLYVLEGASLGGQVLLKSLQPRFGGEDGFRFLQGYGLETGRMWRNFLYCLSGFQGRGDLEQQQLVASAVATFEAFERWLALQGCLR